MASDLQTTDRDAGPDVPLPDSDCPDPDAGGGDAGTEADPAGGHYGYLTNNHKAQYLRRLRRIEGQARGLQRMIEDEQYCIDILTQVSAMNRALESVALGLLDDHLDHCVTEAAETGGEEANRKLKEASQAIARMVRS